MKISEEAIGHQIKVTATLIKRRLDKSSVFNEMHSLTGTHGYIIGYLHRKGDEDVFQKDLEKIFKIRRSSVTELLNLMEKNGLITRESVNYDARLKKIVLTEKAVSMIKRIDKEIEKLETEITANIPEEHLKICEDVLAQIRKNLE